MPTLAQVEPVATTLNRLLPAEPVTQGALTVVPLLAPPPRSPTGSPWARPTKKASASASPR
jgi:hypothetical protein